MISLLCCTRRWLSVLILTLAVTGACNPSPTADPPGTQAFDSLFHTDRVVLLTPPEENPIGNATAVLDWQGHIAVVDEMQGDIKLFDASGRFVGAIGGAGDGPGEFRSPVAAAVLPGGDLAVLDQVAARVTRFDSVGEFKEMWNVPGGLPGGIQTLPGRDSLVLSAKLYPTEARGLEAEARDGVHLFTSSGHYLSSFRPRPPLVAPHEASFTGIIFGLVGRVAVAGQFSRNIIDYRDLLTGEEWSDTIASSIYRTPNWQRAAGSGAVGFADESMWLHRITPLGGCQYVASFATKTKGERLYNHVIHGIDGTPGGISKRTHIRMVGHTGERLYATMFTDDGDVELLVLRLRSAPTPRQTSGPTARRCTAAQ